MICAYSELYVQDAQNLLAGMLDYAVYSLKYSLDFFYQMFLESSYSEKVAYGDVSVVSGKSGVELAKDIVFEKTGNRIDVEPFFNMNRSHEYWIGWALAYYQWTCNESFQRINNDVPITELVKLYSPYHEMDISQFVDQVNSIRSEDRVISYLKQMRLRAGISQRELSEKTDIPLKTIQHYEQRQKNINKAQVDYVIRLSKALDCEVQDVLE